MSTRSGSISSAPARIRLSSRVLRTNRSSRSASSEMVSSSSRRSSGSMRDQEDSSVPAAALTAVKGVRRLWLTADKKPARWRPTSATSRASRTSSCRRRRSTPAERPATSASSSSRSAFESGERRRASSVTPGPSTRTLARGSSSAGASGGPAVREHASNANRSPSARAALRSASSTSAPSSKRLVRSSLTFASASRCTAVARRVERSCTIHPTNAAEARNTTRATTSSVRWILNDPVGSVKKKFSTMNPTNAPVRPAGSPSVPTARTVTRSSSAATVRSASAARARPATPPTASTAAPIRINGCSRTRILVDTIARIPLTSANADVRDAVHARSRRVGDRAGEARTYPGGHRRSRGDGPEGARAIRARWVNTTS